jgi:hypothetical protein
MQGFSVVCNLYDLSQGLAKNMSRMIIGKQIDGIWHTGIVVYGKVNSDHSRNSTTVAVFAVAQQQALLTADLSRPSLWETLSCQKTYSWSS